MNARRLAELIDLTVGVLEHVAQEARALAEDGSDGTVRETSTEREIAQRLIHFWDQVSLTPTLSVGSHSVDLATAQGRWELLVLAILKGARVRDQVVIDTFGALKDEGLLDYVRTITNPHVHRESVLAVLHKEYRALVRKEVKADAIVHNAQRLEQEWQGDLNTLYERYYNDDQVLLTELRSFQQIDRMALWICRTMRLHGVWPHVGAQACRYHDKYTRLPLKRLYGLCGADSHDSMALEEHWQDLTDRLFYGDLCTLYLQGFHLCNQNDIDVCLSECPAASWCSFPQSDVG